MATDRGKDIKNIPKIKRAQDYLLKQTDQIVKQLGGKSIEGIVVDKLETNGIGVNNFVPKEVQLYLNSLTSNFDGFTNDPANPWGLNTVDGRVAFQSINAFPILNFSSPVILTFDAGKFKKIKLNFDFFDQGEVGYDALQVVYEGTILFQADGSGVWKNQEIEIPIPGGSTDITFRLVTDGPASVDPTQTAISNVSILGIEANYIDGEIIINDAVISTASVDDLSITNAIVQSTPGGLIRLGGIGDDQSNIGLGKNALLNLSPSAVSNIAIGTDAMKNAILASGGNTGNNVGVGSFALQDLTTGAWNTSVGVLTSRAISSGSRNSIFGSSAGQYLTIGNENVMVGHYAGRVGNSDNGSFSREDDRCTFVGPFSGRMSTADGGLPALTPMTNSSTFGNGAQASKSNQIALGDENVDEVKLAKAGSGFSMKSPDGTEYLLTVANGGTLSIVPA